jgi:hypothetical protein
MPRISGTYNPPAGQPVVTGTTISSSVHNTLISDIGNEITNSIPRDGSAPPTANVPMGNFKITGLANGTASNDAATLAQIDTAIIANNASTPSGFKNKIIGGDFTTNPFQRGTTFTSFAGGYSADRWFYDKVSSVVHTISQSDDAPTASQAGVYTRYSLGLTVTTIDDTIASTDYVLLLQPIEGFNAASFGFGQSGTRSVTLSFWVKAAKTGIHCVALKNSALSRSYVAEYTITTANTWQKENITIPVDTASGLWLYDNRQGLNVVFTLACGTTYQTTKETWTNGNFLATSNQVNEVDTIGNNFKIALVQLEAGSTATQFETRSVGTELALCQRYYEISAFVNQVYQTAGQNFVGSLYWKVEKRVAPTVSFSSTTFFNASGISAVGTNNLLSMNAIQATATATGSAQVSSVITALSEL